MLRVSAFNPFLIFLSDNDFRIAFERQAVVQAGLGKNNLLCARISSSSIATEHSRPYTSSSSMG
jgi:hypothetical protein